MYNNIERELKILVTEEIYENMIHSYDFENNVIQTNTYYDDENQTIKNKNGAMRIRTIGNQHIFTLKIKKDSYTHYEYEKEIQTSDINKIDDIEINGWMKEFGIPKEVKPIITFTTERKILKCEKGEICVDKTTYLNHIDYEIEYEYNCDHDGISFFNKFLAPFHMKYTKNCPSKIARAMND